MAKEYSNQWKGICALTAMTAVICFVLWLISYEEGAGSGSFRISLGFVFGEAVLMLFLYYRWYRSVNTDAAHMYDLVEMQAMSRKKAAKMQGKLLFLSLITGGAGAALILIGILFPGISSVFSYSALLGELLGGNILLHILTHQLFLPNRIIGQC